MSRPQQEILNAMAAGPLGPTQGGVQNPQEEIAEGQHAPGQERAEGETPPSQLDNANKQGAPKTEDDEANENPVVYKLKIGEEDRELSEAQIKGTFERYGKLNEQNNAMRPLMQLYAGAAKANPGLTPDSFAKGLIAMANKHNPSMGGQDDIPNKEVQNKPQGAEEISEQFDQWEKDNAATLPPGYKEMMMGTQNTGAQMQQMMQMMQQVLGRSQGMLDAGQNAAAGANNQAVNNAKNTVANNLSAVQQKLQLPDEAEKDFMMFAAERGYTMEDFIDPMTTLRVATDFKNGLQSGEVARLKAMQERRQAFTGAAPTQPGGGGGAPSQAEDPALEAMIAKRLG